MELADFVGEDKAWAAFLATRFFFSGGGGNENNFISLRGVGRRPALELLELLLGANGLGDLEHDEAHCLAQGLALTHCYDVANVDVLEAGGEVYGHVLVLLILSLRCFLLLHIGFQLFASWPVFFFFLERVSLCRPG